MESQMDVAKHLLEMGVPISEPNMEDATVLLYCCIGSPKVSDESLNVEKIKFIKLLLEL